TPLWIGTEKAFAAQPSANAIVHCFGAFLMCGTYVADGLPATATYCPVALSYFQSLTWLGKSAPLIPDGGCGVKPLPASVDAVKTAAATRAKGRLKRDGLRTIEPPSDGEKSRRSETIPRSAKLRNGLRFVNAPAPARNDGRRRTQPTPPEAT